MYGQDPVGIPYEVDVSPCSNYASLSVSSQPPLLSIEKVTATGNIVQNFVNSQWLSRYSNNYASNCPIMRLSLKNSGGGTHTDSRITLVNSESPTTARIDILNTGTFSTTIRLYAFTMGRNTYLNLPIRVCGVENIVLTGASSRFYIDGIVTGNVAGMSEASRYIIITQSTFQSWFAVSPTNDPCVINEYLIYQSISPLVPWPSNDDQV